MNDKLFEQLTKLEYVILKYKRLNSQLFILDLHLEEGSSIVDIDNYANFISELQENYDSATKTLDAIKECLYSLRKEVKQ